MRGAELYVFVGIMFAVGHSDSVGSQNENALTVKAAETTVDQMKDCNFYEVYHLERISCNRSSVDDSIVPHGTNCIFRQLTKVEGLVNTTGTVESLICTDGHWSGTDVFVGSPLNRHKRFFIGALIGVVAGAFGICVVFCGGHHKETKVYHPPTFESPCKPWNVRTNYNVAAGESVRVRWTVPKASDVDGDKPRVYQSAGISNGGRFTGCTCGRTYAVTYTAEDNTGLKAHCTFSFTVTESACASPRWPSNGQRDCDDFRVGSRCRFQCHSGYQLLGYGVLTCQNTYAPRWSHSVPTCRKITCRSPPNPPTNGAVRCTDSRYSYQSYCYISCNKGYSLHGQTFTRCEADGRWLNNVPTKCRDETPPSITCKSPQIFYADRGVSSTSVNWKIPTATDAIDSAPNVIHTSGPSLGDVVSVGSEYVTYRAIDSDGNKSPSCRIELRIQEITCGHPLDTFQDKNVHFECNGTRYTYGVECQASCAANLPLEGAVFVTCEDNGNAVGKWEVAGNGSEPYCKEISCPDLDPPNNGALVYDSILTRPISTMMCNEHYDIPYMGEVFNGMFFCTDNAGWQPTDQVPDCTNKNQGASRLYLPGQIFYYEGNCGTNETMADIKAKFQHILNDKIKPLGISNCPINGTCTAENIVIRCGDIVQERRRRSTNWSVDRKRSVKDFSPSRRKRQAENATLVVELDIVVNVNLNEGDTLMKHLDYYDDIVAALSSAMQELVNKGALNMHHFKTKSDSWEAPSNADVVCDTGYVLTGGFCKPCPLGHYLKETGNTCVQCPIGQFAREEGSVYCMLCPTGYSTKQTGSKSLDNCTELCRPGTISPNGMKPCSTCLYGEYQDGVGQTSCKQCPRGTTTQTTNSTSSHDCQNYDILIEETIEPVGLANITSNMTLMFWTMPDDDQTTSTVIKLTSDNSERCIINLTDSFWVQVPDQVDETMVELSSERWTHQAIVWNTADNTLDVYVNGYMRFTSQLPSSSRLFDGELTLTANSQSGLYMTGYHLYDRVLTSSEITAHVSSCHVTSGDDVIDIDIFRAKSANGISVVAPSTCDAVDNCQPDPCNGHQCVDNQDSFTCRCNSGWSGATCLIPPDYCTDNQCTNGATCQSGVSNYTCGCLQGYSGLMCEVAPVDGGWSEWKVTSACTQRCGTGSQTRKRTCDSPVPDLHGADCDGNAEDTIPCNTEACRVCKDLPTKSGTLTSCMTNITTGIRTCTLYCEEGKIMPHGLSNYLEYECGPHTDYEWEHSEALPSCVEPSAPTHLEITTSIEYTTNITNGNVDNLIDSILHNFQSTTCKNNCHVSAQVSGTTLTISYSIALSLGPELHFDQYVAGGTVSGSLQELVNAVSHLERLAQHLQNHTSDIFNAIVNGTLYTTVTSSLTTEGFVKCPNGQVAYDGTCLKCPAGTYSDGHCCILCDRGSYQPSAGQSECIHCPSSLTTKTVGSTDLSKCSELLTSRQSINLEQTSYTTMVVAVVVSMVALVVACLAIALVWYKKRRSTNNAKNANPVDPVDPVNPVNGVSNINKPLPITPSHSLRNSSEDYYSLPKHTQKDENPYATICFKQQSELNV